MVFSPGAARVGDRVLVLGQFAQGALQFAAFEALAADQRPQHG